MLVFSYFPQSHQYILKEGREKGTNEKAWGSENLTTILFLPITGATILPLGLSLMTATLGIPNAGEDDMPLNMGFVCADCLAANDLDGSGESLTPLTSLVGLLEDDPLPCWAPAKAGESWEPKLGVPGVPDGVVGLLSAMTLLLNRPVRFVQDDLGLSFPGSVGASRRDR
jgi:hypothetical protein